MCTLLLLAATVRSFAHIPLGISDRNNVKHPYRLSGDGAVATPSFSLAISLGTMLRF